MVNTITHEENQWVLCKEQMTEGCVNVLHLPRGHNHEERKAKMKAWNATCKGCQEKREKNKKVTAPNLQPKKLTLFSMLKYVLTTKLEVSDADASKLIEEKQ